MTRKHPGPTHLVSEQHPQPPCHIYSVIHPLELLAFSACFLSKLLSELLVDLQVFLAHGGTSTQQHLSIQLIEAVESEQGILILCY